MIIWGLRTRSYPLGQRPLPCPHCHREAMTSAARARRWFTLFFIPLLPIGATQIVASCGLCGYRYRLGEAHASALFGTPRPVAARTQ
jgi:zinc-ribbon family